MGGLAATQRSAEHMWRPLIEGSLRDEAEDVIDALADALAGSESAAADFSFAGGSAGIALFYSYLAEAYANDRYRDIAERHLRRAARALAETPMGPSLYEGFTGIAWTIEHLKARLSSSESDRLGPIDDALLHYLDQSPWTRTFDLIEGLVGIGVYALERLPRPGAVDLIGRVLDRLEESAEVTDDGTTWVSLREWVSPRWRDLYPPREYNLGVAHGVPGVIGFLGGCLRIRPRERTGFGSARSRRVVDAREQARRSPRLLS
ncbi:MAG: lanthionine synthetase LanC family protein [Actinomycetota bacterium]